MKKYLKMMRVHHYIKNLLVFVALLCSGQFFVADKFVRGLVGFIAFCALSSVVYIVNDIQDRETDRLHPTKCKRPIASGEISVTSAWITAGVLAAIVVGCSCYHFHIGASALLLLYLLINLAYSFGLKNYPIIDIAILVSGYLIRVIYGALITGISISNWLYLTVISVAFFCAIGKRRNELRKIGDDSRKVLKRYSSDFLNRGITVFLTLSNVFYALWSVDETTQQLYNNSNMVWTVPLVLLMTMKYTLDLDSDTDGDPVEVFLHDKILIVLCLIYIAVMAAILYLF